MNTLDPRELRAKIDQQVDQQRRVMRWVFFGVSIGLFVLFSFIATMLFSHAFSLIPNLSAAASDSMTGGAIMLAIGWLVTLIYQGLTLFFDSKAGERAMRTRAAQRVLAREQLAQIEAAASDETAADAPRKPKRDEGFEMTDDGEIQPLIDQDEESKRRAAQQ